VASYNPNVVTGTDHGLRKILEMLKSSRMILHLSEKILLLVVVGFLLLLKISLPLRGYGLLMILR
jgi:hypothetical protein